MSRVQGGGTGEKSRCPMKKLLQTLQDVQDREIRNAMAPKDAPEGTPVSRFAAAYDQWLEDNADNSRAIEDDGFHCSTLGIDYGKCPRRSVYLLKGVAKRSTVGPRIRRVFGNGHAVHDRLQKDWEVMAGMVSEVPIKWEDPPIRGHADGVLEWEGEKILVEIKSCNDEVFANRLRFNKAKKEHFDQCNIYAYVLGIKKVWIVYENKDNQNNLFFEMDASIEKAEKQLDKWRTEYEMFKEGVLPARPYKPSSPTCAPCDLKYHCFADAEIGVKVAVYKKEKE